MRQPSAVPVSPPLAPFDQRVIVEAELHGGAEDRALAEAAFEECGWPVLRTSAVSGFPHSRRVRYVVEVRLQGAFRRSATAALHRVRQLARTHAITLIPLVAEPLPHSEPVLPVWFAHSSCTRPATVWGRGVRWLALRAGLHDTGRVMRAPYDEAVVLAQTALPRVGAPARDTEVRPPVLRRASEYSRLTQSETRHNYRYGIGSAAGLILAGFSANWAWSAGWSWLVLPGGMLWALLTFAAATLLSLAEGSGRRPAHSFIVCLLSLVLTGALWSLVHLTSLSEAFWTLLVVLAVPVVGRGVHLLVRGWTRRQVVYALALAFLPAIVPWVAGLGTVLHLFYAAEFGLSPEDLEIPLAWQALAALVVLAMTLTLTLVALALCGYLKHYHWWPTERLVSWLSTFTVALGTVLALLVWATEPPSEAGVEARAAGARLRDPGQYFGVRGELTCVTPVVARGSIPVHGGVLTPSRPYLVFGVVDGRATLWDPRRGEELSVPGGMVRLTSYEADPPAPGRCPPTG
ncbi:hypothetical protein AB0C93_07205 [Streptomyces sp. NPDC048518]|uniref:hypothetical protein n=1 Tax=Streptomyces sp. NPDC048518 TaxID=3155029 RepID=UPI0033F5D5DC